MVVGRRQGPELLDRLNDDLPRQRHIQSGRLRKGGDQAVMLGMGGVGVEAAVKFVRDGEPEQRNPEAEHQRRDDRLGEAADAVECGFSAQGIGM